ncbi:MAG: metallophosphoesterase, partial [Anaerolineae bacterium]
MKQLRFLTIIAALVLLAALLGSAALANTTAVSTAAGPADTFNLTLLHTNDFHARVDGQSGIGGSARLATTINEFRAANNNVMLVDAGDQFQGTLFYRLFKADIITQTMNLLGYDAMTIGNHEFDDGPGQLARLINGVNFPVV